MNFDQLVSGENQSIKIVPTIEESLRDMGLNVYLDDESKLCLEQLRDAWKTWKKSPALEAHIISFLQSKPDPHRIVLIFVVKCEEYKDCKQKSLPYFIVETLLKFAQFSELVPNDQVKLSSFQIAIQQRNQQFLNLIVKAYQLVTIKEQILPIVRDMIKNDNCKQASQIVIAMKLFEHVPVEDLMFPLILQDKPNLIDEYLTECPTQVIPLLLFLDRLLDKKFSIREFIQDYIEKNKISHIKYDKIHYKPLGKLVARLCNKFNVPIETCINLSKNRTIGGLRYLVHQRYQGQNLSSSVWDDLVKDSLKQNADSGRDFINMLVDYDSNEALKWANYLNLPENELPLALKDLSLNEVPEDENWNTNVNISEKYYKFSLPENHIVFIETGEQFYDLIMSDVVRTSVVSLDCEWKPSFGATQSHVALIQLATTNKVYLIDTLLLNKSEYASFWYTFNKSFLDNAEIIKVGFGLEQDLKEMKSSVIGLGNIKVQGEGLLDLGILWKSLLSNGLMLPSNSDNGGNSLSSLVESCFGLPLEKSEQCSNWELRPLRKTQMIYAALDAHVLIQIYDFLQKLCTRQQINFEEICNDVMLESKKKCTKKPKVIDRLQSTQPVIQLKSVCEVKFLVEPILSDLMPYLRCCGIDTTLIAATMMWHDVINLAISEDRFIILGKPKLTPTTNFPQNSILSLSQDTYTQQLRKVFNHFNIKVEQDNLFNYCLNCNSKDLKKLSPDEVTKICQDYEKQAQRIFSRYDDDDDDVNGYYDNFLSDSDCDEDLYQPDTNVVPKTSLTTNKGVQVEIHNASELSDSNKPAILCEECGKLFWDEDILLKQVREVVLNFKKLKIW